MKTAQYNNVMRDMISQLVAFTTTGADRKTWSMYKENFFTYLKNTDLSTARKQNLKNIYFDMSSADIAQNWIMFREYNDEIYLNRKSNVLSEDRSIYNPNLKDRYKYKLNGKIYSTFEILHDLNLSQNNWDKMPVGSINKLSGIIIRE